jgi:hypothetical protein
MTSEADGSRKHPAGHHAREVERRDARHHTERLAHRPVVDAARDLLREIALQQLRDAAGELEDLDAARHLTLRVREHLAVLTGDERGEGITLLVHQLEEARQDARAAHRRGIRPGGPGGLCARDRGAHVLGTGQDDLARYGAGGGIEYRQRSRAGTAGDPAADPVLHELGGRGDRGCGGTARRKRGDCHGAPIV